MNTLAGQRTQLLLANVEVKIYEAHSAAALLAFSIGARHEMAAGTRVRFQLPLLKLDFEQFDPDDRRVSKEILKNCREIEAQLAKLPRGKDTILAATVYNLG